MKKAKLACALPDNDAIVISTTGDCISGAYWGVVGGGTERYMALLGGIYIFFATVCICLCGGKDGIALEH